ncbi:hypothetical protein BgiMline_014541 [Biomphalaria glabrata]|nr:mucin-4 [Biomphalaria glabrata]
MPVTRNQSNSVNAAKPTGGSVESSNTDKEKPAVEAEPQRRESPDNCSICLGPFINKSFTSSCAHSFCFVCLKQWSKVKAECPLCKQPFTSIFHNIRSDQSYDIYELPALLPSRHGFEFYFPAYPPHSHPYISLAQPSLNADLTLSNFSRYQFRHRRSRFFPHPVHGEHQYSFLFNPATHVSASSWPRGPEDFRRAVYKHRLGPPLFILGNETSTYRLTPAMVAASAHRLQRIMPWLTRELKVLLKSHQNVRLAISIIQPLLTQVLIDSHHFNEKVSSLIGRKARQFIQEFSAFANSALTMEAFDRKAIYFRQDTSSLLLDNNSSRSSNDDEDDVVEITDVSSDPEIIGRTSPVAGSSGILRSGWNSPTPGPSWGNLDVINTLPVLDMETVSVSSESDDPVFRPDQVDSESSSLAGSDIVFLKYDKPWTERSPIQLSSDSERERRNKRKSKRKKKKREHFVVEDQKSTERLKSNEKSKEKNSSEDEATLLQETNTTSKKKRVHSSSSEKQKRKKKKKNRDLDRELVDKLFAQALSQTLNASHALNSDLDDGPCSSKSRDNTEKANHSEKGKHKHKKKERQHSSGSQSSSNVHSYKKHHSGHKKSGDRNQENENGRRKHKSKHSSQNVNIPECSHEGESSVWDAQLPRTQPLPSQVGNSNFHQTNFLTVPDTLQHIPLNLWVSAWPAIPTSHTFSSAPTSSSFMPSTLPVSNNSVFKSRAIPSDSSSEMDSDDTEDYSMSSATTSTRTKQWLEDNFRDKKKSKSSKVSSSKNSSVWATANLNCIRNENHCQGIRTSKSIVNVVSVSDDEDVVVCSGSSSSGKSDCEVQVIKDTTTNLSVNKSCTFQHEKQNNSNLLPVHSLEKATVTSSPQATVDELSSNENKNTNADLLSSSLQAHMHENLNVDLLSCTQTHRLDDSKANLLSFTHQAPIHENANFDLLNCCPKTIIQENVNSNLLKSELKSDIWENKYALENGYVSQVSGSLNMNCVGSDLVNSLLNTSAEPLTFMNTASACPLQTTPEVQLSLSFPAPIFTASPSVVTSTLSSMLSQSGTCAPLNLMFNSVPPFNPPAFPPIFPPISLPSSEVASSSSSKPDTVSNLPDTNKNRNVISFGVEGLLNNSKDGVSKDSCNDSQKKNNFEENTIIAQVFPDQQQLEVSSLPVQKDSVS